MVGNRCTNCEQLEEEIVALRSALRVVRRKNDRLVYDRRQYMLRHAAGCARQKVQIRELKENYEREIQSLKRKRTNETR